MPTQKVARVNLTKEEFQQWKIHPEVCQTIMNFNTPKKKFSSDHRKLIIEYNKKIPPKTWSTSSGNTRTLPNTPWVPDGGKSKSISCHQGQEEGVHEPDNLPTEETSGQDQQLLAMVHETINALVDHPSSDMDQVLSVNGAVRSANNITPNRCHELPSGNSNPPNSHPTSHEDSPDIPEQNFLWSQ